MKKIFTPSIRLFCTILVFTGLSQIQAQERVLPADTTVVTKHSSTINGKNISYTATTGTQPVWDESGKAIASLYYTIIPETMLGSWKIGHS